MKGYIRVFVGIQVLLLYPLQIIMADIYTALPRVSEQLALAPFHQNGHFRPKFHCLVRGPFKPFRVFLAAIFCILLQKIKKRSYIYIWRIVFICIRY